MDILKVVNPSQLIADRGSNLVVINLGSANVRIGFAHQQTPFVVPHCIARHVKEWKEGQRFTMKDQMLNSQASPAQNLEREKAYYNVASMLKLPFLDDEAEDPFPRKMGRVDGHGSQSNRVDTTFTLTTVMEKKPRSSLGVGTMSFAEPSENKVVGGELSDQRKICNGGVANSNKYMYKDYICGEEALKISSIEPYRLSRPIRRGHFNVSQHYPQQQVIEDLYVIWNWIVNEKLHIHPADRNMYSAVLVVPETFDNREIKELLSLVLRDLQFGSAVVHQEGFAATCGNGLTTACVVNLGAQVSSVICVEDGVAMASTSMTLPFGGEDISRFLLWIQRFHQTWPSIHTNPLVNPADLVVLNQIKESCCEIKEGEVDSSAVVYCCEEGIPNGSHSARLSALNVPPMGLFYPTLLVPEEYPPPPRTWFHDHEDMLEDTWHMEFLRRPDFSDGLSLGLGSGPTMWDSNLYFPARIKEENLGLAEAITSSILSTGRIDLQRKLFCSIQLIGGVALTKDLVAAVEERVLHAIPSNEAIDTVEVLQSRSNPSFVSWKGGAILGILDFCRESWNYREDWIRNGIHVGSGRKYKDSYYLQAQAMSYIS